MKCQNCKVNPASVYYTKIVNGERVDFCLCSQCASENSILEYEYPFKVNNFLTGLFEIPVSRSIKETKASNINEVKCQMCGLTFEEFKRLGSLGCAQCYETFKEKLEPILKRLHGNVRHSGKHVKNVSNKIRTKKEIDILRSQLEQAIKHEKYEKAAQLRDQIKELETIFLRQEG